MSERPFGLDDARDFVASVRWTFAKTMPWIPHWYTVFDWITEEDLPRLEPAFDAFVDLIWEKGVVKPWPAPPNTPKYHHHYLELDGWEYWVMTPGPQVPCALINRARLVDPGDPARRDALVEDPTDPEGGQMSLGRGGPP